MTAPCRGFTLIELIVYLALFSILIGGAVIAAYNLFDANTNGGTRVLLEEESDFALGKLEYALANARAIDVPAIGETTNTLVLHSPEPVRFMQSGESLELMEGSAGPTPLLASDVHVEEFSVTHMQESGQGIQPEWVAIVLVLSARSRSGLELVQYATSTLYLKH